VTFNQSITLFVRRDINNTLTTKQSSEQDRRALRVHLQLSKRQNIHLCEYRLVKRLQQHKQHEHIENCGSYTGSYVHFK